MTAIEVLFLLPPGRSSILVPRSYDHTRTTITECSVHMIVQALHNVSWCVVKKKTFLGDKTWNVWLQLLTSTIIIF
jgi:hypothetical protein